KALANYNWNDRNPTTNLLAHTPNETSRWDGLRSATTTPAVYVPALLRAYEFTGDELFRDQALTYLESWAQYAYDPASGSFWGSLELDGTPVPDPWAQSGYAQFEPRGLIDLWAPEFITAQYNPDAAKAYANGYQALGDPDLLDTAEKWAALIRNSLPATHSREDTWYATYSQDWAPEGTYAEHYGHLIDFFTTLYEDTSENHYLMSARTLAQEAVSVLWFDGLLRGHPNKPYYEAVDGVGVLLESLIDLDAQSANFTKFGDFDANGAVDLDDYQTLQDHWLLSVAPYEDGDVTGDGFVSLEDFSHFKNDYFEGLPTLLSDTSLVVPEPQTLGLLLAGLGLFARRRSRLSQLN
ncbi:MAG: PEP-CTERM sorting domain-containing protein, partial [Bythopirellula sp.]